MLVPDTYEGLHCHSETNLVRKLSVVHNVPLWKMTLCHRIILSIIVLIWGNIHLCSEVSVMLYKFEIWLESLAFCNLDHLNLLWVSTSSFSNGSSSFVARFVWVLGDWLQGEVWILGLSWRKVLPFVKERSHLVNKQWQTAQVGD